MQPSLARVIWHCIRLNESPLPAQVGCWPKQPASHREPQSAVYSVPGRLQCTSYAIWSDLVERLKGRQACRTWSVRQYFCVSGLALLYAPAAVAMAPQLHTTAIDSTTGKSSKHLSLRGWQLLHQEKHRTPDPPLRSIETPLQGVWIVPGCAQHAEYRPSTGQISKHS